MFRVYFISKLSYKQKVNKNKLTFVTNVKTCNYSTTDLYNNVTVILRRMM